MTSPMTGPAWYWIAGTTALVLWAWALAGIPLAVLARRRLRASQRAAEDQAIAVTRPPARAAPPPAPGHHTGPVTCTITAWECGCILLRDGAGRITGTYACRTPDLDTELRDLLR